MVEKGKFKKTADSNATQNYYSTLLHELTHWTGHESRLKRDMTSTFGTDGYAFEELVAELGATFLCASLEIEKTPREDHAKYLNAWIKQLSEEDGFKLLHKASTLAQKGIEFLDNLQEPQDQLDLETA